MREIVLDTETTGLDPANGDRIVEIGCLELVNRLPTGETYHAYINPERDMPREAEAVHGLSAKFLADKPRFAEVADDFLAFVSGAPLIIHNAAFDMKFLNAKWRNIDHPTNVLSFPNWDASSEAVYAGHAVLLGDVVLARQTVEAEADNANLPLVHHVKHLVVHGVLHLLGFDHETDQEANIMESLEVKVLSNIGVASPYKEKNKENVI